MRLLNDTNIILDIALKREPYYNDSAEFFKDIDNEESSVLLLQLQ